jgi:hypothetical protein
VTSCCSLGYRQEVIRAHFGDRSAFGVTFRYRADDPPLGTAGALHPPETCWLRVSSCYLVIRCSTSISPAPSAAMSPARPT